MGRVEKNGGFSGINNFQVMVSFVHIYIYVYIYIYVLYIYIYVYIYNYIYTLYMYADVCSPFASIHSTPFNNGSTAHWA